MNSNTLKSNQGSAILGVLLLAAVFLFLASEIMRYVSLETQATKLSPNWSEAFYTAHSGVEAALARLDLGISDSFTLDNPTARDGEGSSFSRVNVAVTPVDGRADLFRIRATGLQGMPPMAQTGLTLSRTQGGKDLRRFHFRHREGEDLTTPVAIRVVECFVQKTREKLEPAILTQQNIRLQHQDSIVDSFDSSNPQYSSSRIINGVPVPGFYDVNKRRQNGNIGTKATNGGSVELYGKIYGDILTNGIWKEILPINQPRNQQQMNNNFVNSTGNLDQNFRDDIPSVQTPNWPVGTFINRGSDLQNQNQTLIAGAPGAPVRIKANEWSRNVRISLPPGQTTGEIEIWVTGNIQLNGKDSLIVDKGVTAKIYFQNGLNSNASGAIRNDNFRAANLQFFGYREYGGTGGININGNNDEVFAVLYAPNHTITFNGSSSWFGRLAGHSFVGNGPVKIHYDESLGKDGSGEEGLTVLSMTEVRK